MEVIDWVVIGAYFVIMVIAIVMTRKAGSMEDFAVAGRRIPGSIVFASLSASFIGPGYSMGLTNKAATNGYIWFLIFLAFSLQTILVGNFVAPKLRAFDKAYTIGDIMGYRYGKLVKVISGILSFALSAGFVGVIAKASGDLISNITGMSFLWAVIISTIVVVVYSTYGGIKSVIISDLWQFIVLAISIPLILIFMGVDSGLGELAAKIPDGIQNLGGQFPPMVLVGLFLGFLLGEALIPPYTNRALMAKSSEDARAGFLKTGVFSIIWFFVCASIGILGASLFPGSDNVFLSTIDSYLPVGLAGLTIAALISIIMSSQDSILNAAAVTFNNDILSSFSNAYKSGKTALKTTRWLNLLTGVIATIFAINVPGIVEALLYCYTLWAPTVVLPLVIAVLKPDAKPQSALLAIVMGGVATGIWEWGLNNPYEIPSLLIGVIVNQLTFWSVQKSNLQSTKGYMKPITEK